jgi:hypothetical protein
MNRTTGRAFLKTLFWGDVSERNTKTVVIVDVVIPIAHGSPQVTRYIVERTACFG